MAINLLKDVSNSFLITDPIATISLEWDQAVVARVPVDCDLSVAMLVGATGRMASDRGLVFYNNHLSDDGALLHKGDAIEGGRSDEAEVIEITLGKVHHTVAHLYVFVTLYDHLARGHLLSDLPRAVFRVRRGMGGATLFRTLIPPAQLEAAADAGMVGRFSRVTEGWRFEQQWSPFVGGLEHVITHYGPA